MPIYLYKCPQCSRAEERIKTVDARDNAPVCLPCERIMTRQLGAPRFRFAGVPTKGGGPDKFTADMLGLPLKELPDGLKQDGFK